MTNNKQTITEMKEEISRIKETSKTMWDNVEEYCKMRDQYEKLEDRIVEIQAKKHNIIWDFKGISEMKEKIEDMNYGNEDSLSEWRVESGKWSSMYTDNQIWEGIGEMTKKVDYYNNITEGIEKIYDYLLHKIEGKNL